LPHRVSGGNLRTRQIREVVATSDGLWFEPYGPVLNSASQSVSEELRRSDDKKQAMRFSVWDEPRVIGCAENHPNHIALPRGCLDGVLALLRDNSIGCEMVDERYVGLPLDVAFASTLRPDQELAVAAMLHHDAGVLCAPTAFGKTVTAAATIARRGVNTLVLVQLGTSFPTHRDSCCEGVGRPGYRGGNDWAEKEPQLQLPSLR
jgi:hypothetical protein